MRRFRFADGFSHSRALGLQFALAVLPLLIACLGLTRLLGVPSLRLVLHRTVLELTPGASDAVVRRSLPARGDGSSLDVSALAIGALVAVVALATAMGQVERGANRIYGIDRDRPSTAKYGRALVMAGAVGLPVMAGSLVLVTAGTFAEAVESQYGVEDDVVALLARPVGATLVVGAITAMLRFSRARRQPGWSFLLLGGVLSLGLWTSFTVLLAGFLQLSAAEFRRATEVTYLGYVYATQPVLPRMKARDRGAIVHVGSALAYGDTAADRVLRSQARHPGSTKRCAASCCTRGATCG